MQTRSPAVAGTFYAQNPAQLQNNIEQLLQRNNKPLTGVDPDTVKAVVVPHAGYIYSGPIAATAYNLIAGIKKKIRRVVLLGPSHRVPLRGIAMPDSQVFRTPLGDIQLDTDVLQQLKSLPEVAVVPQAHAWEHSLEVQLPFLQMVLDDFLLVPLVVGHSDPDTVTQLLEIFWADEQTLIVISSDLSHYLPYDKAKRQDSDTSRLIEARDFHLQGEQACGCYPLNGLLKAAQQHGFHVSTLDLRNSGDTAGSRDQVVGYGAYAVYK